MSFPYAGWYVLTDGGNFDVSFWSSPRELGEHFRVLRSLYTQLVLYVIVVKYQVIYRQLKSGMRSAS